MNLLKNRKFAILIAVVIAVIATLSGVYRTANRYAREIDAMFYEGVYLKKEGYTQPGIDSHLNNAADAALGLATIMANYPEFSAKAENLILARREFIDAVSISDKSSANFKMWECFFELTDAISNAPPDVKLTGRDIDAQSQYYNTFLGAEISAHTSQYKGIINEYMNRQSFLVHIAGLLIPLREPEYFYSALELTGELYAIEGSWNYYENRSN